MMRAAIYNGKKNILLGELEAPKAGESGVVSSCQDIEKVPHHIPVTV